MSVITRGHLFSFPKCKCPMARCRLFLGKWVDKEEKPVPPALETPDKSTRPLSFSIAALWSGQCRRAALRRPHQSAVRTGPLAFLRRCFFYINTQAILSDAYFLFPPDIPGGGTPDPGCEGLDSSLHESLDFFTFCFFCQCSMIPLIGLMWSDHFTNRNKMLGAKWHVTSQ